MSTATFDIETDGLLHEMTEIKCLNLIDHETGERTRYTDYPFYLDARTGAPTMIQTPRKGDIAAGLEKLQTYDRVAGQNIEGFDLPALRKLRGFHFKGKRFDTLTVSRLLFPDLKDRDLTSIRKGKLRDFPPHLIGTHKLESWGLRLGGEKKGDFKPSHYGDWTWNNYPFSKECDDYCMQDVATNVGLVEHLERRCGDLGMTDAALDLEHDVARIISMQQDYGWAFDVQAAEALTVDLMKAKLDLESQLIAIFGDFYQRDGVRNHVTKKSRKVFEENDHGSVTRTVKKDGVKVTQRGWFVEYVTGVEHAKVKLVQFSPGSRHHIADRLTALYGWEPTEFTPEGSVKVDETILGALTYPEAPLLAQYFGITKMLGQVSEGKGAYLKCVKKDGRIHGSVNPCGAVTGRMTHSSPNVANADKDKRVRSLFKASPNMKLVGTDADSLELRCLAHFLARYDGGEYIQVVLSGNKADGTDMHTRNKNSMGLANREPAKTVFYAWLYGAGDFKIGSIIYSEDWDDAKRARFNAAFQGEKRRTRIARIGGKARKALVAGINGAEALIGAVQAAAERGYLKGLDGRRIQCRSKHSALNTLLQSAGALVMKKALVIADAEYRDAGLVHGVDYGWCGNIHDEVQIETKEQHAEFIGTVAAESIRVAGEHFNFRCPLAGQYAIGNTWAETH